MRAHEVLTGRLRHRRRIDKLESKLAFMSRDHEELYLQIMRVKEEALFNLRRLKDDCHGERRRREALEERCKALWEELRARVLCVLDHQDWKAKVWDLEDKVDRLATHSEHWHVTALHKVIEDLRARVVAERQSGKTWQVEKRNDGQKIAADEVLPDPADDTGGDIEDSVSTGCQTECA